ncbi:MAG: hypothetical protein E6G29_06365, partial [Actinobacteria bacterium]
MAKRRLHELAKERGLTTRDVIQALESAGIEAKSALSTVEEVTVEDALKKAGLNAKPKKPASKPAASAGAAQDGAPGVGQWIRLRRRRRQLRRLHKSQLKDLAGLAVELYRIDSPRGKDLAAERLKAAAETESELIELDRHFGPVE